MALGEFELIAKYFSRPVKRAVLGVGDDCALIAPSAGMQLAVSTDMLVEGRHFLSTIDPARLGHKALAVNLSDLAACAAQPLAYTLGLSMPRVDEVFLQGFSRGLHVLADEHGVELIGGDTTAGPMAISITVLGEVPPDAAPRRAGARVGDDLWVSHPIGGGLGDARVALEVFRGTLRLSGDDFTRVRERMERPVPRVALGIALRGLIHAAIDLSDGLLGDLGHVLRASRVGATIHLDAMPRSAVLAAQAPALQRLCLLAGGDDYELLFAAPRERRDDVRAAARASGTGVTRIGGVEPEVAGLSVLDAQAKPVDLGGLAAFDHFKV